MKNLPLLMLITMCIITRCQIDKSNHINCRKSSTKSQERFFQEATNLNGLHNISEAIDCMNDHNKPLLLVFYGLGASSKPQDWVKKQSEIFLNNKIKNIINREFILASLLVDNKEILENDRIEKLVQLEIFQNKQNIMSKILNHDTNNNNNKRIGQLNQQIQIALCKTNSQMYFAVLENISEIHCIDFTGIKIRDYKNKLYSDLTTIIAKDKNYH